MALSWSLRNTEVRHRYRWPRGPGEAVVRLLLEKGADVESKSSRGGTLFRWPRGPGQVAVVGLLVDGRADVQDSDDVGSGEKV